MDEDLGKPNLSTSIIEPHELVGCKLAGIMQQAIFGKAIALQV